MSAMNAIVSPKPTGAAQALVAEQVVVGKDVLELITGAMYVEPLSIYREYVQNAADAIEDAIEAGHYDDDDIPPIVVTIKPTERSISILDLGIGIPPAEFFTRITAVGASPKRGRARRGFRGIGRLSGLAYCQELIFRSRSAKSQPVSELRWDVKKMRAVLRDPAFSGSLTEAIVASVTHLPGVAGEYPDHFFEVTLNKVGRFKNDVLLDDAAVESYLCQVGPLPFDNEMPFTKKILAYLNEHNVPTRAFPVRFKFDEPDLLKLHRAEYVARLGKPDQFSDVELFTFEGVDGEVSAVGWVLHHSYLGALPPSNGLGGLRLRKSNIQIGSADITVQQFHEARFNAWIVGEIHVVDPRIVPNGRRDDFEPNIHYSQLQMHISLLAKQLSKRCRETSSSRTLSVRLSEPVNVASRSLKIIKQLQMSPRLAQAALTYVSDHLATIKRAGDDTQQAALAKLLRSVEHEKAKLTAAPGRPSQRDATVANVLKQAVAMFGLEKSMLLLQKVSESEE